MVTFLRQNFTLARLLQLWAEFAILFGAVLLLLHYVLQLSAPMLETAPTAIVFAVVLVALNGAFGVYRRVERLSSGPYLLRMLLAASIGIPLAFVLDAVLPGGGWFGENVTLVAGLALGLSLLRHAIVLPIVSSLAPHRVLVLGTGAVARQVEQSLAGSEFLGLRIAGFYPLRNDEERAVPPSRVVGSGRTLRDTVRALRVAEIIVAVREQRGGVLPLDELLDCRLAGVQVTDLARFYEQVLGKVPLGSLKISWLIYASGYRQRWVRAGVKRLFDLAAAGTLLVLASPLMGLAALAILFETGRPLVYRQVRVGLGGRPFTLLKFRSMGVDAEKDRKPQWAVANDVRVTRVGRWLRRSRIDELPQLVNVLRGEMSFVGPRPERPEFVAGLQKEVPYYAVRHTVKPGLTGWAQVRYSYGATVEQAARKLEYDLYYVKNHSLVLDLVILFETIRVVMLGEGAR